MKHYSPWVLIARARAPQRVCLHELPGDGDVTGEVEDAADFACRDWTQDAVACRSGLPNLDQI